MAVEGLADDLFLAELVAGLVPRIDGRSIAVDRAFLTRLLSHPPADDASVELRRGVFELPQETAEGAAQMRRVIVDQIEALAELNRIVARHGRNLDAVEPVQQQRRMREEPTLAVIGGRNEMLRNDAPLRQAPARPEVANFAPAPRRAEAPSLSPVQPANPGRGWLSDLLARASRDEAEPAREFPREPVREPARADAERPARHSIESLDS